MRTIFRVGPVLSLGVALAFAAWPAGASAQAVEGPALKAAFVLNFVRFTEWPEDVLAPSAPIIVCVAQVAVAAELDTVVADRTVNGHAVMVRRVKPGDAPRGCAVFYLSGIEPRQLQSLLPAFKEAGVLCVSDDDRFAERGGMVGLFAEGGRMRFAVNTSATGQARLKLSAKLLSLARIVKD